MTSKKRACIISLGCSKNLVDSERLLRMLENVGYETVHDPSEFRATDTVIINTCGFIGDAKEESVNMILQFAYARSEKQIASLYVMGCLSERYKDSLPVEIPEVDGWFGKTDWPGLVNVLSRKSPGSVPYDRVITTPRHHAYLKISEGCNRFCAFCAIPLITGRYKSRPMEEIEAEVRMLVQRGVKEFNVIAQDLTNYGYDLYGVVKIGELVNRIAQIEGVKWIRLHYAYPANFPMDLLDAMANNGNVCKYLDIALQHASSKVLDNMRRHISKEETEKLLATIRERVPGIHIRTTLMVGFPGEGESEFDELMQFVREQKFERMGAFAYSEEEDTYAAKHFDDSISQEVKQQRLDKLMALQQDIALSHSQSKIGQVLTAIIDREEPDYYVGRTEFDSPEVDPELFIDKSQVLVVGEFYQVEVTDAMPYELFGKIVK
ncbi:MAG: 30S ribosomal protein S12 methylthiotransferase RimO [Paramuribaculum sp.]|nr:30S ribosomal protein S12 methylthiotransferase RimO [Paramuribaculum sp.]